MEHATTRDDEGMNSHRGNALVGDSRAEGDSKGLQPLADNTPSVSWLVSGSALRKAARKTDVIIPSWPQKRRLAISRRIIAGR